MHSRFRAALVLCVGLIVGAIAFGQTQQASPSDLRTLFRTLKGLSAMDNELRLVRTETGYISYVGTPAGGRFRTGATTGNGAQAEAGARQFLADHAGAFARPSAKLGHSTMRVEREGAITYVRLRQTYDYLPVFGGETIVQLDGSGGVQCVFSNIVRDASQFDQNPSLLVPSVSPPEAKEAAIATILSLHPNEPLAASEPALIIYDPAILDRHGMMRLAWQLTVSSQRSARIAYSVLVDAQTGEGVFHYSLVADAKDRRVYDAANTGADPGIPMRFEGDPAVSTPTNQTFKDVDLIYDYFGDTYDYYKNTLGRDSLDNQGLPLSGTARYCEPGYECPLYNAFYNGDARRMYFGEGYATDDVVGHELTHGVTDATCQLIYLNESGAINESLSDIMGEFVDFSNSGTSHPGNDSAAARWRHGEDLPGGANRDMKDPTRFGDPDRYNSPLYYHGSGDNGGVHFNSGVGNKLCYLLTDGDNFNGFDVLGIGSNKVAKLFYECQAHLLKPADKYRNLGIALIQAATNQYYTNAEKENVTAACMAVEIVSNTDPVRDFQAMSILGEAVAVLTWHQPVSNPNLAVTIVRKEGAFPTGTTDPTGVLLFQGIGSRYEDRSVVVGNRYYYGLFAAKNKALYTQVIAGKPTSLSLAEAFATTPDLAYTQVTFIPAGDILEPLGTIADYTATITKNVSALPVPSVDALSIPMPDDWFVSLPTPSPFPFFGTWYRYIAVSSNGYLVPRDDTRVDNILSDPDLDVASYASHFGLPRISALFSNLDPRSGGEVWYRGMDDRFVVTYDHVPEYGSSRTNTVQVEVFYSGHIRLTYLDISLEDTSVCGLSNGLGVPTKPTSNTGEIMMTDLSNELPAASLISLDPVPVQWGVEKQPITFTVHASSSQGTPVLSAALDLAYMPGATFAVAGNVGTFAWTPDYRMAGSYRVEVSATVGSDRTSQIVQIEVESSYVLPSASNLAITPSAPEEGDRLVASYDYSHPQNWPEVDSQICWYCDGGIVPGLLNQRFVPGVATKRGQQWYFSVVPRALAFLEGEQVISPVVTVAPPASAATAKVGDVNYDGRVNAIDVQQVINGALGLTNRSLRIDVDGNNRCDAIDVQVTINGALGF